MQMGTRTDPRRSYIGEQIPSLDPLTRPNVQATAMGVQRLDTITVVNDDSKAVATPISREGDDTVCGCVHRCPPHRGDVDAVMALSRTRDRMSTDAVLG